MQQLHLVGFTTDQEGLIFSARRGSKSGGYFVVLDKKLLNKIEEAHARRDGDDDGDGRRRRADRPESVLTPREIQARLRSGRTITQVAREAGVEEEWVARFAAPIQAEQAQVITRARALVFSKPRLGDSAAPLGESVAWNAAEKGVRLPDDLFDECWSAFHLREHEWVLRFAYVNRKKTQHAEWEVDLREGTLLARNRLGSELGYLEPGRRRRRLPPAAPPPPAVKATARRGPKKRTPAKPAAKSTAKKATRRPAGKSASKVAKRPAGRSTAKPTAKRATTKPTAKRPATKAAKRPATKTAKRPATKASPRPAATRAVPSAPAAANRPAPPRLTPAPPRPSLTPPAPRSSLAPPRPSFGSAPARVARAEPPRPTGRDDAGDGRRPPRPDERPGANHPAAGGTRPEPPPIRIVSNTARRDDERPAVPPLSPPAAERGQSGRARDDGDEQGVIRLPAPSGATRRRQRPLRAR